MLTSAFGRPPRHDDGPTHRERTLAIVAGPVLLLQRLTGNEGSHNIVQVT